MSIDDLLPTLREQGSSSTAYHSLQPGLDYYSHPGLGYVPFKQVRRQHRQNMILVSGDPISAPEDRQGLLGAFLERYPTAAFFQIDQSTAEALNRLGHYVNEFGIETILHLPYDLHGGRRADVRLLYNRAKSAGVGVHELTSDRRMQFGVRDEDIATLSRRWVRSQTANYREFSFLSRSFRYQDEPDCRKFYALHNGKLVGLSVFDPMYRAGKIVGYAEVIARTNQLAPKGTRDFLLISAMNRMANEGIPLVSLGLSPMAAVLHADPSMACLRRSMFARWCFDFMYRRLDRVMFNFQGLHFKKGRYAKQLLPHEGAVEKRYCAFTTKFPLLPLYHAYAETTMSPIRPLLRKPLRTLSTAILAVEELLGQPGLYLR